ncbi:4Fe-4S cluster-binding domain-containing protein [Candidatus Ruminimicrobium bovinum]
MVDGKFEEDKKNLSLAFRGSENQRIWKKEEEGFKVIDLDNGDSR